ncbi:glycogen-binding domain-containing protein [Mucilaginibacter arboris]|nr:glycogen-binding domain-containing protein [Mucilaginibacter arboris]
MLLMLCSLMEARAQKRNRIVMSRDHLILIVDVHTSKTEIDSLLRVGGIVGQTAEMLLQGNYLPAIKNGWDVKAKKNIIELNRSLSDGKENIQITPYFLSSNVYKSSSRPGYPSEVAYGVNNFSRVTVHELSSGLTRFFVPGNIQARRVFVSGSFNNWSTIKGNMNKTDSGWVFDVRLEPGKYAYKFIINSNWTTDVNNKLSEDDGVGNNNSIYFRYNYTFRLAGYPSARKITVAGSFNKWNEIPMRLKNGRWECPLYLHDGNYLYRFIVDGYSITDPANKLTQVQNSVLSSVLLLGEAVTFKLNGYTNAHKVFVAGTFNNWDTNMLPLTKTTTGWILHYTISAGNYQYKFIADGQWIVDPLNPNQITIDGNTNSFLAVKPNHTFTLKGYSSAHTVRLAGNFNNWNEQGYTLEHKGDVWIINIRLKPGKYLYKFLVDGNWILDPGNKLWEQNQYGTGNSVIWIE